MSFADTEPIQGMGCSSSRHSADGGCSYGRMSHFHDHVFFVVVLALAKEPTCVC